MRTAMLKAALAFFSTRSLCTYSISSSHRSSKTSTSVQQLPISRGCMRLSVHQMEKLVGSNEDKLHHSLRLHKVAGHMTEILEFHAEEPCLQVLFIPGNPGIVSFYRDYIEAVYQLLGGKASVTAIGHIAHTQEDWEDGRLFSLQEQISHKIEFIKEELLPRDIPILLAGHSIGAYISLDIFKAFPEKVSYMIGMYPFLTMNKESSWQAVLTKTAMSSIVCAGLSSLAGLIGLSPSWFRKGLVKSFLGRSWSSDAVDVASTHLLRYSMVRNFTFMGMTEFKKLQTNPDWTLIREKEDQIAFLFGIDDHWGPLSLSEEVSRNAPGVNLTIEKEGHTHAFCCTKTGSAWVANHTVDLIKQCVLNAIQRNADDQGGK
eukprot:Gb_27634 [translate_table: standard]